jgi:general L-amino acid transport system permease protein
LAAGTIATRRGWIPWRSRRGQRLAVQGAFLVVLALLAAYFAARATRLDLGFGFLTGPTGFALSHQWITEFESTDERWMAYLTGAFNTVRLVVIGIALATLVGVLAGVARLSNNWLVAKLATFYVEALRNTPLLVQIVFWYTAVLLKLPRIDEGVNAGAFYISNRALVIPWAEASGATAVWGVLLLAALVVAYIVRRWRFRREELTGEPSHANSWALRTFLLLAAVSFVATGLPLDPTTPEIVESATGIQRFVGGLTITPEFLALLLALTFYTGTFIAEIVRGSIQALDLGQTEAAKALGLNAYQRMTLVILPQALRTAIPSITNQYLNLAKNSSLAIVVAYSELFSVGNIIINKVGHAVPMFIVIIVTYQVMSLLISAGMNYLNARVQLAGP